MTYIPAKVIHEDEKWVIELSKYERDNLLWLLLAAWGWNEGGVIEPFNLAFTGDWTGMIPSKLMQSPEGMPRLTEDDHPNWSHDELRKAVDEWLKRKIEDSQKTA